MTDIQYENIPNLNDITNWIFECNRFLFFAKVKLSDPTYSMKFYEDPIVYVEKISSVCKLSNGGGNNSNTLLMLNPKEKHQKLPSVYEIKIKIAKKKLSLLHKTISLIKAGEWTKIRVEEIEECQKILLLFFNALKRQVGKINPNI